MADRRRVPGRQQAIDYVGRQARNYLISQGIKEGRRRAIQSMNRPGFKPYGAKYPTQKGRYKPRYKKYYKPKKTSLKKKVKTLERKVNQDLATHTFKKSSTGRAVVTVASQTTYSGVLGMNVASLETSLGSLRFYDPGTNALVTNSAVTGTYSRSCYIQSIYSKMTFRNNYRVPCVVDVYICTPKKDTSIGPVTAITNGLTDQNNPSSTSTLIYPSDSDQFKDLWNIHYHKKKHIGQGKQFSVSFKKGSFHYDPADFDTHNMAYQKRYGSHVFLIRVQGILAHDSVVTTEQGLSPGGVDYFNEIITKIRYDAGKKLNDITLDDGYDTFTNAEEVGIPVNSSNHQFSLT